MKHAFEEVVDMVRKAVEKCPWLSTQNIDTFGKELLNESKEVAEAIENKDSENLKEELGDVVWDALVIAIMAEKRGLFKAKDILTSVKEKMVRRKPYLYGDMKECTLEEARQIWRKVKEEEQKEKNG